LPKRLKQNAISKVSPAPGTPIPEPQNSRGHTKNTREIWRLQLKHRNSARDIFLKPGLSRLPSSQMMQKDRTMQNFIGLIIESAAVLAALALQFDKARRERAALRELEKLDQSALNDLGMTRADLVTRTFGREQGACANF
jgi:uncharacterized protein YjiS (DUF1127 family)